MSNGDYFPWDETQDSELFPSMIGLFRIDSITKGVSRTGKRMDQGRFICEEPAQFINMSHFENFVMGTDENPAAVVAGAMGTKALKKLLKNFEKKREENKKKKLS